MSERALQYLVYQQYKSLADHYGSVTTTCMSETDNHTAKI